MPRLDLILWDVTADHGIAGAMAGIYSYSTYSDSEGRIYVGTFSPGSYTLVVNLPSGYGTIRHEYPITMGDADIVKRIEYTEAGAGTPITPPYTGAPIEVFNGFDIYQNPDTLKFYYFIAGVESVYFDTIEEARASISAYLASITPTPPVTPAPTTTAPAPANLGWLQGVADWFGNLAKWFSDQIAGIGKSVTDEIKAEGTRRLAQDTVNSQAITQSLDTIKDIGPSLATAFKGTFDQITSGLTKPLTDFGPNAASEVSTAMSEHSPDPKVKAAVEEMVKVITAQQAEIIKQIYHSPADPNQASDTAATLAAKLIGVSMSVSIAGALIDILHPIKGVGALEIAKGVVEEIGIPDTVKEIMGAPVRFGIMPPLQKYLNSVYQPNLPGIGDLTNMRMKEVIGQPAFREWIKYQGYSEDWADKYWDAHYTPPSLSDILTAWRRKIPVNIPFEDPVTGEYQMRQVDQLSEDDVKSLMERIDLDPRYFDIFATRKYVTPPIGMTRFLFETGAIKTREEVTDLVALEGYEPKYIEAITDFIVNFQARRWRVRYLQALSTGYTKGVRTTEQIHAAVIDAGYTEDVAKWLIDSANVRLDIEKAKGTTGGAKLLSEGELKRLYLKNHLSADQLRTELQVRGYSTTDIDLLIVMLDEEKVVVSAGGSKVALSIPELLSAMRYGKMTEDQVGIELQLRGLSLQETEILISTKKAQWGMITP
jgi:hypothetical protein